MKLLLFDLDGTLYSSRNLLPSAYREGIESFNESSSIEVDVPGEAEIFDQVGNPADEIYENLFPQLNETQRPQLQEAIFSSLLERIKEKQGKLFEGVRSGLKELSTDHTLALVTNAQTLYMETVLATHDLGTFFEAALCNDDAPTGKKAELVEDHLNRFQVAPERTLLVGDRASDRRAAREHGIRFIKCTYGYGNDLSGEDESIDQFEELPHVIDRLKT